MKEKGLRITLLVNETLLETTDPISFYAEGQGGIIVSTKTLFNALKMYTKLQEGKSPDLSDAPEHRNQG